MSGWLADVTEILTAFLLVAVNGFFVAAEFALVKVRPSRIEQFKAQKRPFAKTASWLVARLESSLSACQLGITMASLALGWVGEPAFAHLLRPLFIWGGLRSETVVHAVSFVIAFTAITALHLVIGEQTPKIFAIRRPEAMLMWCALPLKFFYIVLYPPMAALNATTSWLLKYIGLDVNADHNTPHSEQEIRTLLHEAHAHGSLSGSEHRLLNAVFEFDDIVGRRIMVPRSDVDYFDINQPLKECIELARRTKHTRYPVCDGSLDDVLGVLHIKDLLGIPTDQPFDLRSIMRPPRKVPENMPISKLLRHFQGTHQLLAFVIDEYGLVIGVVTLENVLEQIVGAVDDEFDIDQPNIVPDGHGRFIVKGSTPVELVESRLHVSPGDADVDTFSGLLMHHAQRLLNPGDRIDINGAIAEVLEIQDDRATRVRVILPDALANTLPGDKGNATA